MQQILLFEPMPVAIDQAPVLEGNKKAALKIAASALIKYCTKSGSSDFARYLFNLHFSDLFSTETYSTVEDGALIVQDLVDIPILYERNLFSEEVAKGGIFYTPPAVVAQIVDNLGTLADTATILDPACGGGIFLLESVRRKFRDRALSEEKRREILLTIYGIDIDQSAIRLSRALLLAAFYSEPTIEFISSSIPDLSQTITSGDALLPQTCARQFDYVIGNPPYGISRDAKISDSEKKILTKIYQPYINGRINKYLLFIVRGTQLLRLGGTLSYIIPNAWLGIREAFLIRKLLLTEGGLQDITFLPKETFITAVVEPVIIRAVKDSNQGAVNLHHPALNKSFAVTTRRCLAKARFAIPTKWSPRVEEFISGLEKNSFALGGERSSFVPRIALQAYAAGKGTPAQSLKDVEDHIYHGDRQQDQNSIPYLNGSDVGRYQHSWTGQYLQYGPWLAEPQERHYFEGPRILIREITGKHPFMLHATMVSEPFVYNKSVLHILPSHPGAVHLLPGLLAYLNSKIVSLWLSFMGKKCQRTIFPKVVLDDILTLPVPSSFLAHAEKLGDLCRKQIAGKRLERDEEINQYILSMLGISPTLLKELDA